MTHVDTAEVY